MVEPIRRPVHSRPPSFGPKFLLYQRNIENLGKDRAPLGQQIRQSVAELFDAALESRAAIAIKGASLDVCSAGELAVAGAPHPSGLGGAAPVQFDAARLNRDVVRPGLTSGVPCPRPPGPHESVEGFGAGEA
jgi:hypothetical protein